MGTNGSCKYYCVYFTQSFIVAYVAHKENLFADTKSIYHYLYIDYQ